MTQTRKSSPIVKLILVLLLGAFILLFPISLPAGAGDRDLQAYWSSAYLFAQGEDFSDPIRLGEIEHTLTTRDDPETLYSWFSPIGNVVLLPFTVLPFNRVVSYWLIINILVLFVSSLLIWGDTDARKWIPLLAAFSFSMTPGCRPRESPRKTPIRIGYSSGDAGLSVALRTRPFAT